MIPKIKGAQEVSSIAAMMERSYQAGLEISKSFGIQMRRR